MYSLASALTAQLNKYFVYAKLHTYKTTQPHTYVFMYVIIHFHKKIIKKLYESNRKHESVKQDTKHNTSPPHTCKCVYDTRDINTHFK